MKMKEYRKNRYSRMSFLLFAGILLVMLFVKPQKANAESYRIKGIDVSRWQGKINWSEVKKDGIEFVMLGLGRLKGNVPQPDPYYKTNIKGALSQNIKVGAYLYSVALTEAQARAEAQYVLDQIEGYTISFPVAFDIEDPTQMRLTTKKRTDIAIAFMDVIADAGYYPMLYASENWLKEKMDLSRLVQYDKWVAKWSKTAPSLRPFAMWQYSSTGKVKGISTAVDLSYCYEDYSQIIQPRKKAGGVGNIPIETGWQTDGEHWWYVQKDGSLPTNTFATIDGINYFFDADGYRAKGWTVIGKNRYFFDGSGIMKKGWLKKKGKYYYLDKTTGAMATGWITVDGSRYYMNSKGVRQKGWLEFGGKYYYLDKTTGIMKTGWLKLGKRQYYLDENGARVTGIRKIDGKKYEFDSQTGVLLK